MNTYNVKLKRQHNINELITIYMKLKYYALPQLIYAFKGRSPIYQLCSNFYRSILIINLVLTGIWR